MRKLDKNPIYYVYEHYKPNCDEPFYVGKGHDDRAYWKYDRNPHWHNTVNKHGFEVRFVAEKLSEQDAFWLENVCIVGWGRKDKGEGPLVNMSDGGEGSSGAIRSDEWKQAHSGENASCFGRTGKKHPMFGKVGAMKNRKHKPESLKLIKDNHANMKGENNPMFGKIGGMKGKKQTQHSKDATRIAKLEYWKKQKENDPNFSLRPKKPIKTPLGLFDSCKAASIAHGFSTGHITWLCKNPKHPEYDYQ